RAAQLPPPAARPEPHPAPPTGFAAAAVPTADAGSAPRQSPVAYTNHDAPAPYGASVSRSLLSVVGAATTAPQRFSDHLFSCITLRYANRMAQVVTRLDDKLLAEVDRLVADGVVANRSEAVRQGLERLVDQHRRRRIGSAIAEAYRRRPQTDEELAGLDEA